MQNEPKERFKIAKELYLVATLEISGSHLARLLLLESLLLLLLLLTIKSKTRILR